VSNPPSIALLLDRWDELREQGREVSVAELCPDTPELWPDLQDKIDQLKAMDWLDHSNDELPGPLTGQTRKPPAEGQIGARKVPTVLGSRYKLESLMAEGGFGQVWRAMDTALLRPVAVKVTTVNCIAEARRVAQLKHHGIVTVHDVGNTDGLCYIVFDLVEGRTLAEKILEGSLTWQQSVQVVADVALSVQFAHDKGFIHRDIKPSNILLDATGLPVLADFGIAVTECELRHEAITSIGTLAYMAPEQLEPGRRIDVRTDVYGLGVVLYELLAGVRPYTHSLLSGLRALILKGHPASLRASHPAIPESIERICLTALSTNMDDRYASARQFSDALKEQLQSGLVEST
jgi:serine/threonine protein kinase